MLALLKEKEVVTVLMETSVNTPLYSFVRRTFKLWNQLPEEELATFPCTSHIFRERVRNVIVSKEK